MYEISGFTPLVKDEHVSTQSFQLPQLCAAVQQVKKAIAAGIEEGVLEDLAFIGNASDLYRWEPCGIVDLDVCLFVQRHDRSVGLWLLTLRKLIVESLRDKDIDVDLRIIRGAYKNAVIDLRSPSIVAHVSLFTEQMYLRRPILLRWAWRKYSCVIESGKLRRLAPARPDFNELLHGRAGVLQKLESIESGNAPLVELNLPDLNETRWSVHLGDPLFAEYCLSAAATCSRNHARVLGLSEPDALGNSAFAEWYDRTLIQSSPLLEVFRLKHLIRTHGYADALTTAPSLARNYLQQLRQHILDRHENLGS